MRASGYPCPAILHYNGYTVHPMFMKIGQHCYLEEFKKKETGPSLIKTRSLCQLVNPCTAHFNIYLYCLHLLSDCKDFWCAGILDIYLLQMFIHLCVCVCVRLSICLVV
jgi:hypothetical protein